MLCFFIGDQVYSGSFRIYYEVRRGSCEFGLFGLFNNMKLLSWLTISFSKRHVHHMCSFWRVALVREHPPESIIVNDCTLYINRMKFLRLWGVYGLSCSWALPRTALWDRTGARALPVSKTPHWFLHTAEIQIDTSPNPPLHAPKDNSSSHHMLSPHEGLILCVCLSDECCVVWTGGHICKTFYYKCAVYDQSTWQINKN